MHGFIPPERYIPYLTWPAVQALAERGDAVLVQPVGAIEQHGPGYRKTYGRDVPASALDRL